VAKQRTEAGGPDGDRRVPDPAPGADGNGAPTSDRAAARAERRAARASARETVADAGGELQRGGRLQFVRECIAELKRVQWPGRQQLWSATAVVVIACIVVGVYLYALDSVFTRGAEWLIEQQAG
jgi:preprotein translocase subunit SecE